MKLETKILILLQNQQGLSESLIKEILKISLDERGPQIRTTLNRLKKEKALTESNRLIKITGNGLKRLPRAKGKIEYRLPYWLKNWTMIFFEIPEREKRKGIN